MIRKTLDLILSRLLIIIMSVMVVNVVWQVASRYILQSPSTFTDELAGFLLIWLGLLGAAYLTGQNGHLAIDLLLDKLTGKNKMILDAIIRMLILFFAVSVLIIGGIRLVYLTFVLEQLSSVLQISLGYIYVVLPISGFIIAYYCIDDLFHLKSNAN